MASTTNDGVVAAGDGDGVKDSDHPAPTVLNDGDGFQLPEMHRSKLSDTSYDRHLFLCYKSPEDWHAIVEDTDHLPKLLFGALKARKKDISVKTRLTICQGSEETDGDVLIFPEMVKYRGLKDSDVDCFVEDVLVNGKPWASRLQEVLTGSHIYVCAHNSRNERCGVSGLVLINKFKEEIQQNKLKDEVFVSACSDVGGHKYAGNVIIFSADGDGKIIGHWYGYVSPSDVPELLDQHIGKGKIIERLWRGQMGAPTEEAEKLEEPILSTGNDVNITEKAPPQEVITEEKEDVVSCYQGATGFSCYKDEASEVKPEEVKPVKKGLGSRNFSSCTRKREQREILTAAAVVRAVTTVDENTSRNFCDYLAKYGAVEDDSQLVGFALDVSRVMEALHAKNIVFMDLSMKNILINDKEVLTIGGLDECCQIGSRDVKEFKAEDVYRFGIILWQMMTCNVAYHSKEEIMRTVFEETEGYCGNVLSSFPPRLLALLRECLAPIPSDRPRFDTVREELEKLSKAICGERMFMYKCLHKTACFCERE